MDAFDGKDWASEDKYLIGCSFVGMFFAILGVVQGIFKIIKKQILKGICIIIMSGVFGYFFAFILSVYVLFLAGGPPVDDYDSWKIENGERQIK